MKNIGGLNQFSAAANTFSTFSGEEKEIKFPFKRNGLPCCEDEPLRKSPSSEKVVYEYFDTYDMFLFCMPMKDTQNCIQTS